MGELLQAKLRTLSSHPMVGEVRGVGLIAAVEFVADKATKRQFEPLGKVGAYFFARGHDHGVIIRNVQDSICICPPLVITAVEINELVLRIERTLDDAYAWAKENVA